MGAEEFVGWQHFMTQFNLRNLNRFDFYLARLITEVIADRLSSDGIEKLNIHDQLLIPRPEVTARPLTEKQKQQLLAFSKAKWSVWLNSTIKK